MTFELEGVNVTLDAKAESDRPRRAYDVMLSRVRVKERGFCG